MPKRLLTLRLRLLVLVLVAVTPALVFSLQARSTARRVAAQNVREEALRLARLSALEEEQLVAGTRQFVTTVSHAAEVRDGDWAACGRLFSHLLTHYRRYNNIGVVTLDGRVVCSGIPLSGPVTLPDTKVVRRAAATRDLAIGNYQFGRIAKRPAVTFDYPVIDEHGNVLAVVFASLNLGWLESEEFATVTTLPPGSTFAKLDSGGRVLAYRPETPGRIGRPYPDPRLLARVRAEQQGVFETSDADGIRRVYAFATVATTFDGGRMHVILSIPSAALFASIDSQLRHDLTWLSIAALLAIAGAWVGGDVFLLRRIRAITAAMLRTQAGDLAARTGVRYGPGELSQLARGFDEMAASLQDRDTKLRAAEAQYRTLVEQAPAVIYTTALDPVGSRLYVSPQIEAAVGFSQAEWLADPELWSRQIHPSDRERVLGEFAASRAAGKNFSSEYRMLARDGSVHWFRDEERNVRDEDGRPLFGQGVLVDVTDRKQFEKKLERSERELRLLTDSLPVLIAYVDDERRYRFVNKAFEEWWRLPQATFLGKRLEEVLGEENSETIREHVGEVLAGRSVTFESEIAYGEGKARRVQATFVPNLAAANEVVGFFVLVVDISEMRRLEEQLRHAQKMEAVGRLAGGVAHDFNNLLQAMLSHAQLLRKLQTDPVRVEAIAEDFERQIKRGASLTRQLLLFSRREAAKWELIDLNEAVAEAAVLLRRLVRENITFFFEPCDGALFVKADRGQLDQVLMNLVVNASDAMEEGGALTIRTGHEGEEWVWFAVQDSGHGIPEEIRAQMFEPFFTTKGAGRGTGLGLSVVHGIVAAHSGRIDVETAVGTGSTFKITLPRAVGAESLTVVAEPERWEEGHGERVLVVEDEEDAREGLREILASLGYEVLAVGSGEEAARLPAHPGFDVLLSDLILPGIAGPDMARGLLERWPKLKVILMSGYTEDETVRSGIEAGKVRFLQKPFDMATLAREIRAALNERAIAPALFE